MGEIWFLNSKIRQGEHLVTLKKQLERNWNKNRNKMGEKAQKFQIPKNGEKNLVRRFKNLREKICPKIKFEIKIGPKK